jgi:hypothetical protein
VNLVASNFDERCIRQFARRRDFGFADAGRADHQNVFRRDFMAQRFLYLLTTPAVTQRNRNRFFALAWPTTCLSSSETISGVIFIVLSCRENSTRGAAYSSVSMVCERLV